MAPHSCVSDPSQFPVASAELQSLVQADQEDRKGEMNNIDWSIVSPDDLQRRIRVGELFGRGCLKEAQDYAAAAMIYQHGDAIDHVYQTFIWAKKAVELGDEKQKWLMAAGLDRYLVRTGHQQLFATQGSKGPGSLCWCLEPVEASFPNDRRMEYVHRDIPHAMEWIQSMNVGQASCTPAKICDNHLKPSTVGTVPGFW
jgi:hypothetical protein